MPTRFFLFVVLCVFLLLRESVKAALFLSLFLWIFLPRSLLLLSFIFVIISQLHSLSLSFFISSYLHFFCVCVLTLSFTKIRFLLTTVSFDAAFGALIWDWRMFRNWKSLFLNRQQFHNYGCASITLNIFLFTSLQLILLQLFSFVLLRSLGKQCKQFLKSCCEIINVMNSDIQKLS